MSDKRFSVAKAIAAYLKEDVAQIESRRYQPTRTPCPVYATADRYLTATSGDAKPPRLVTATECWRWREIKAGYYCYAMGWHIWRRLDDDDVEE